MGGIKSFVLLTLLLNPLGHSASITTEGPGSLGQPQRTLLFFKEIGYVSRAVCPDRVVPSRRNCRAAVPPNPDGLEHSHTMPLWDFNAYWREYDALTSLALIESLADLRRQNSLIRQRIVDEDFDTFSRAQLERFLARNEALLRNLAGGTRFHEFVLNALNDDIIYDARPSAPAPANEVELNRRISLLLNAIFERRQRDELREIFFECTARCERSYQTTTLGNGYLRFSPVGSHFVPPGTRELYRSQDPLLALGPTENEARAHLIRTCSNGEIVRNPIYYWWPTDPFPRLVGFTHTQQQLVGVSCTRRNPARAGQTGEVRFPY